MREKEEKGKEMGGRERALGDARDSPRIPSGRALRSCVSKPEFYSLGGPAAGDGYRRHTGAKVRHITIAFRAATELKRQAAAPGQVWPVKALLGLLSNQELSALVL
ncbi:hypothetical protein [Polaromonas sp. P5_D5]